MSVNKYLPHVFILPEDDANRQIANGFLLSLATRQVYVLREAGGWANVMDRFVSDQLRGMEQNLDRFMVLLVDFDRNLNRLLDVSAVIPQHLSGRVFILGAFSEPEALRQAGLGTYEAIGRALADDCRAGGQTIWGHHLLQHNQIELNRLRQHVLPILF
ncbi:MAG TPA: hypothetical protein VK770_07775 [Candidatus Acidoferrum sp.]|jgi:hypothetical protein|nr:hypothetical protein [Candidatus Acidoferrum sp.]